MTEEVLATGVEEDVGMELSGLRIAYVSMEIGLRSDLPTYSGGLGVLAGDTLRAAADMGLPYAGVSLVHRRGYFRQSLSGGVQREEPSPWDPSEELEEVSHRVSIPLEGRSVVVRAWKYRVLGATGCAVPVFLLDTDLPENDEEDRRITDQLYGGDARYRLLQEAVLGCGGFHLLRALGARVLETFHMNEGHSAFVALSLLEEELEERRPDGDEQLQEVLDAVRRRCVFTTHTPVPAGHDRFPRELVGEVLGPQRLDLLERIGLFQDGVLNMTHVALHLARFTKGVAGRHGQVSREMFPDREIHAITNGVHAATWVGDGFAALFDEHLPGWREDPFLLRHAMTIPLEEFRAAHRRSKADLLSEVERRAGVRLTAGRFTIAFARRAAPYKRAHLLMTDPERLARIARRFGGLQILYAGKAHPRDQRGKEIIRRVIQDGKALPSDVRFVYLEDYDMELGRLLASGSDLWLNNPSKPLEASGTSGMKAALNGVPCLSILDGWWVEGHIEGVTGWSIDQDWRDPTDEERETKALLTKLESVILPLFHGESGDWARVMRGTVAFNGSFYHTRRMMNEYLGLAYRIGPEARWIEAQSPPARP